MYWKIVKIGDCDVIDFAAAELKKYMTMMDSENEYVIMRFNEYDALLKDALWIGVCDELPVPDVRDKDLDDAVSINVKGHSGYITGTNPRSVLIAAYRFLRELGCAFIRPGSDGEVIPRRSLGEAEVLVSEAASYRHRGVCIEGSVSAEHVLRNIDWLPKVGMNAFFNQFQFPFTFYDRWYSHRHNPLFEKEDFSLRDAEGITNASIDEIKRRGLLYHAAGHGWTCEPFGLEGLGWDAKEYEAPGETKPYLALVDGKREIWEGVPLNTNLCYSAKYVKDTIANAVADYCIKYPQVDLLHIWLADYYNNHCECESCNDKRPADLYVALLNRIDKVLTERKIDTKIVFLIYVDLLWEPLETELKNPERFVLMFAPITRTYTNSIADAEPFNMDDLAPYVKNKVKFPKNVSENLARLFKWQKHFDGDSFIYDYHYMWDHFLDPGYFEMAKILFKDIKHLDKYKIDGMVSCQNQRVFFPTALGMTVMAQVLWDKTAEFDTISEKYFKDAFGDNGNLVMKYLSELSTLFNPPYQRGEIDVINEAAAEKYSRIGDVVDGFEREIKNQIENGSKLHAAQLQSWRNLLPHGELCRRISKIFANTSCGDFDKAEEALNKTIEYARSQEKHLHNVFDVCLFYETLQLTMKTLKGENNQFPQ